jgi:hypothetical protein
LRGFVVSQKKSNVRRERVSRNACSGAVGAYRPAVALAAVAAVEAVALHDAPPATNARSRPVNLVWRRTRSILVPG